MSQEAIQQRLRHARASGARDFVAAGASIRLCWTKLQWRLDWWTTALLNHRIPTHESPHPSKNARASHIARARGLTPCQGGAKERSSRYQPALDFFIDALFTYTPVPSHI